MELKKIGRMNKRGDVQSIIFSITVVAVIGMVLFFFSMVFDKMYEELESNFQDDPTFNNTEVTDTLASIRAVEKSVWDYAFLGIAISYILLIGIFSFQTNTSPVFYWISVILSMLGLFVGTILGRVWQAMASQPDLAETVARFPITDAILGTFYPIYATFLIVIGLVLLYGKPQGAPGR